MRRRLNNAYLAQTILMVCLLALLVVLALRRAPPWVFSLVFVAGICLAAAPGIYAGYVLPRREIRRAERVKREGLPAVARILQDGDEVLSEFRRTTMGYRGVSLLLEIPVMVVQDGDGTAKKAVMKAELESLHALKPGMLVSVRCDPSDLDFIVFNALADAAE